jgi:hypothetical protein
LATEPGPAEIAGLLSELASQLDTVCRLFAAMPGETQASGYPQAPDVVFVDDLAHCIACSWARHDAVGGAHISADAVTRCTQLLEASLHLLQRVERMQADARTSAVG